MSYTLTQAKDIVINQGYAIKNDDTVEKLREVLKFCFPKCWFEAQGGAKYYEKWDDTNNFNGLLEWHGNSINLSEIELPKQITIEMVIELRKQYPNNLEFGDAFDKLLNN